MTSNTDNTNPWDGHTPLPWSDCSGPSYSGTYHTVEKDDLMICELYEGEDAVQAANAALIVHCVNNFPALEAENKALREALDRQCDNMAFIVNHSSFPAQWYRKFRNELAKARATLTKSEKSE